jgi:hypothetical protein
LEPAEREGWFALLNAYDRHYRGVYDARPTAPIPMELAKPLGGHIADLAVVLRARLHARNVAISLEDANCRIADKAIGDWLGSKGSDGKFLLKVGHQLKALQLDLPRYAKQAVRAILAEMSPPPPPRTANVVAFAPRNIALKPAIEPQPAARPVPEPLVPEVPPQLPVSGAVDRAKPVDRADAPESRACEAFGEVDPVKRADRTDAPEKQAAKASPEVSTTGKLDPVKRADRTDAPEKQAAKASPEVLTTGKLNLVKRADCTDAPDKQTADARKLVDRLGKPAWCDEKLAREMLHARSADVVFETVSRLRIDEKSMTRPRIYAMIFIALYGPEARNDNRC